MRLPTEIRQVRERLGESQAAFGARFGVDQSTVHRWETDGIPDRGIVKMTVDRVLAELGDTIPSESRNGTSVS